MTSPSRAETCKRFREVGTSNVADALDELGVGDQGLSPSFAPMSGEVVAGFAYTIQGEPAAYEGGGDPAKMAACNEIGPEDVTVWAAGGQGVCYFGELIALGMQERGCLGAVVDGGVRDISWLRQHGFTVFATYRSPVQSIGRWRVTAWQQPLEVAGATTPIVTVHPGDFVLGDANGVIVVPAALIDDVLQRAEALTAKEVDIRAALAEGSTLAECLERFGHV